MHTKLERLLWKSLTTLEVMTYYLVVHMGPGREISNYTIPNPNNNSKARTKDKKRERVMGVVSLFALLKRAWGPE